MYDNTLWRFDLRDNRTWSEKIRDKKIAHNKLDCNAGTLRSSKVNTVTSPKAPAANHSGTAANINNSTISNHELYHKKMTHDFEELNKYQLSLVVRLFLEPQQQQAYHPQDWLEGKACIHLQIYPITKFTHKSSSASFITWSQIYISNKMENMTYLQSLWYLFITFTRLPAQVSFEQHSGLAEKQDPIFLKRDLWTYAKKKERQAHTS